MLIQLTLGIRKSTTRPKDEPNPTFLLVHYNICEVSTSLVNPLRRGMLSNIFSCKIGAIWITYANKTLIIYPTYMSFDVNIIKNYSPKIIKSQITNFNFINLPQPSLLIEHHQNLVRYQFPDLIILYPIHSNAPILKYFSNIQDLLDVVERKKTLKPILRCWSWA